MWFHRCLSLHLICNSERVWCDPRLLDPPACECESVRGRGVGDDSHLERLFEESVMFCFVIACQITGWFPFLRSPCTWPSITSLHFNERKRSLFFLTLYFCMIIHEFRSIFWTRSQCLWPEVSEFLLRKTLLLCCHTASCWIDKIYISKSSNLFILDFLITTCSLRPHSLFLLILIVYSPVPLFLCSCVFFLHSSIHVSPVFELVLHEKHWQNIYIQLEVIIWKTVQLCKCCAVISGAGHSLWANNDTNKSTLISF